MKAEVEKSEIFPVLLRAKVIDSANANRNAN
jgi:hypothetical protein